MMFNQTSNGTNTTYCLLARHFTAPDGVLYGLRAGRVQPVSAKRKQMSGDWLYTTFDEKGIASNLLERAVSNIEGGAARIFENLMAEPQVHTRTRSRCAGSSRFRHVDARIPCLLHIGVPKELAYRADVHASSLEEFCKSLSRFGVSIADATATYEQAKLSSEADLLMQAEVRKALSADRSSAAPNKSPLPRKLLGAFSSRGGTIS